MLQTSSTIVNIGLDVNDGGLPIGPATVSAALRKAGATVLISDVLQSDSELTYVARLASPLDADALYQLSIELRQDCVAQAVGEAGELHGPKADKWGPFNPAYFLTLRGERLGDLLPLSA